MKSAACFRPHSNRTVAAVRAQVGMVFQQFNLFPHLTVMGNIIEAPIHVLRRRKDRRGGAPWNCWSRSGWPTRRTRSPRNCPAASSSVPPSPAPWRWTQSDAVR